MILDCSGSATWRARLRRPFLCDGQPSELIVPLKPDGNAERTQPLPPKRRMIDVWAGGHVHTTAGQHKALSVNAYRDNTIDAERVDNVADGYVVRGVVGKTMSAQKKPPTGAFPDWRQDPGSQPTKRQPYMPLSDRAEASMARFNTFQP